MLGICVMRVLIIKMVVALLRAAMVVLVVLRKVVVVDMRVGVGVGVVVEIRREVWVGVERKYEYK